MISFFFPLQEKENPPIMYEEDDYYDDDDDYSSSLLEEEEEDFYDYDDDYDNEEEEEETDTTITRIRPWWTDPTRPRCSLTMPDQERIWIPIVLPPITSKNLADAYAGRLVYKLLTDTAPSPAAIPAPSSAAIPAPISITNPWKIETAVVPHDPWSFLEPSPPPRPPPPRPERRNTHRNDRRQNDVHQSLLLPATSPPPSRNHHTNTISNKLCKYGADCRMNKERRCTMVHQLTQWNPPLCRHNTACSHKSSCGYYHTDQPIRVFLGLMIKKKDTLYNKHASLYEKYI